MDVEFASILTKIFNMSISNGEFIEDLKLVKVIPIFKNKGSSLDTGIYRPISLLSNIDKIFQKIVHKRMSDYLEAKNVLHVKQFGFRKKSSTVHSLICLTEKIRDTLDKGNLACGCLLYTSPSPRDATLSRMPSSA